MPLRSGHNREKKELTEREAKFALAYARTLNQSEAARQAGYGKGWQRRAHEILARPLVLKAVERHRKQIASRVERKAADVIDELGRIAFQDPTSFLAEEDGRWRWKSPDELTDEQKAAVRSVRVIETKEKQEDGTERTVQTFRYSFHDKMLALVQMGRHHGLFEDKVSVGVHTDKFRNMSDDQLKALRDAFKKALDGQAIEGEVVGRGKMLSDDRGFAGRVDPVGS
jgi:phage terminase small subunit